MTLIDAYNDEKTKKDKEDQDKEKEKPQKPEFTRTRSDSGFHEQVRLGTPGERSESFL
jgi:hypothetical protein